MKYLFIALNAALMIAGCTHQPTRIDQSKDQIRIAPRLKDGCLRPDFSELAAIGGKAAIGLEISDNGIPLSFQVLESSGSKVHDELIALAALKCKFIPGKIDGKPTNMKYRFAYTWPANEQLIGPNKCLPPTYPRLPFRYGEEGDVLVAFKIHPKNGEIDTRVAKSSGFPLLDKASVLALNRCLEHVEARNGLPLGEWSFAPFTWKLQGR
jgi:TonB family protein